METEIYSDKAQKKKVAANEWRGLGKARKEKELAPEHSEQDNTLELEPGSESSEKVRVRVMRACANPRLLLCGYGEVGLEQRVLVRVPKSNAFFRRGMEFLAQPSTSGTEPWSSEARPRFPGRW
jgi:hypothetical protein